MLTVRDGQMQIFSQAAVDQFEDWMTVHLKRFFPGCLRMAEPDLREMIQYGIGRARSYRIRARRDVCKYVDLMAVLGRNFDSDAHLPWAKAILKNAFGEGMRMRLLVTEAQNYLRQKERKA